MLTVKRRLLLVGMLSIQRYSDSGQQTCLAACVLEVYNKNQIKCQPLVCITHVGLE